MMSGTVESTITRLALAEVEGKNKAIHAYDQMIWTVRSGFVTLFFGAWALLFQQLLGVQRLSWLHAGVFGALAVFPACSHSPLIPSSVTTYVASSG
jgi:hypothetical protein